MPLAHSHVHHAQLSHTRRRHRPRPDMDQDIRTLDEYPPSQYQGITDDMFAARWSVVLCAPSHFLLLNPCYLRRNYLFHVGTTRYPH